MSAVATKEESWLNIAQVTESLWPVGHITGGKEVPVLSYTGLEDGFIYSIELQKTQDVNYLSNLVNTRHKKDALLAVMDLIKVFLTQLHSNFGFLHFKKKSLCDVFVFIRLHQDGKRTECFKWVYP